MSLGIDGKGMNSTPFKAWLFKYRSLVGQANKEDLNVYVTMKYILVLNMLRGCEVVVIALDLQCCRLELVTLSETLVKG